MSGPASAERRAEVRRLFRGRRSGGPGAVGVELELLPGDTRTAIALPALVADLAVPGRFTFEPGGQVEYASTPRPDVASLVEETEAALVALHAAVDGAGATLIARGLAPGRTVLEAGLRRPTPRYREMDRYFAARGPWGAWMMRLTASLQVNLDLGSPASAARRWRAANGLAPTLIATFANSPAVLPGGETIGGGRSWVWRQLDPGRTGIVGPPAGAGPPWTAYLDFALAAPVMFDAAMRPLTSDPAAAPTFAAWCAAHPRGAGPGTEDWRTHLTTLFPEVRPRGRLEVRSIDVPALEWWPVAPAVLAAVLYDARALAELEEMLAARTAAPGELLDRAARRGLADPALRGEATGLFRIAEQAFPRFDAGWFGRRALGSVGGFRERYVEAGRTQADEAMARGEVARLDREAVPPGVPAGVRAPSPLRRSS